MTEKYNLKDLEDRVHFAGRCINIGRHAASVQLEEGKKVDEFEEDEILDLAASLSPAAYRDMVAPDKETDEEAFTIWSAAFHDGFVRRLRDETTTWTELLGRDGESVERMKAALFFDPPSGSFGYRLIRIYELQAGERVEYSGEDRLGFASNIDAHMAAVEEYRKLEKDEEGGGR
jgi:hypothetical protein